MDGFVDLFYQRYSLDDCIIVEDSLKRLGLSNLADQFARAKELYIGECSDISEEEYRNIDPFGDDDRWREFDSIGVEVLANGSELYSISERVEKYVKAHFEKNPAT